VGDDVLSGEIALRTELLLQGGEELEIEVHEVVGGTVERAGLRRRLAATGVRRPGEEDRVGRLVGTSELRLEVALPELVHVIGGTAQHLLELGLALHRLVRGRSGVGRRSARAE
jgi:hypothetical protein